MLVLTRKHNETLHIGNDIVIKIVRVRGDAVRIGIEAPKDVKVMRSELIGTSSKYSQVPNPATVSSDSAEDEKVKSESGPLSAFLKVVPKVQLATAS